MESINNYTPLLLALRCHQRYNTRENKSFQFVLMCFENCALKCFSNNATVCIMPQFHFSSRSDQPTIVRHKFQGTFGAINDDKLRRMNHNNTQFDRAQDLMEYEFRAIDGEGVESLAIWKRYDSLSEHTGLKIHFAICFWNILRRC